MRVLVLETAPWPESTIVRALESASGINVVRERDVRGGGSPVAVILLSARTVLNNARRSVPGLQTEYPNARILVVGSDDHPDTIADFISAGADGYFDMARGDARLVEAVHVVSRGSFWLPDHAVALVMKRLRTVPLSSDALTSSDQALVRMLYEGLTNRQMASRINLAEITVRTRLLRLYRKFHVRTRAQLLIELRRRGFIPQE